MREDFGFSLGRWNQSYQFDTCAENIPFEEMVPGDLIFYSATYFDTKKRKQIHDMVHVEIYWGPGEQSIGSRWFKGCIQIFDSHKFESTNYYDIKFHYKSLETWLRGDLHSHCPEHSWRDDRKDAWTHNRSIFADEEA